mmetsp:Transcript_9154/g.15102  ORF Transcript_9154/g.15102 Transcript_9154/m.15102 type:complete len:128 (-) Transcript_9154:84-467(-)
MCLTTPMREGIFLRIQRWAPDNNSMACLTHHTDPAILQDGGEVRASTTHLDTACGQGQRVQDEGGETLAKPKKLSRTSRSMRAMRRMMMIFNSRNEGSGLKRVVSSFFAIDRTHAKCIKQARSMDAI